MSRCSAALLPVALLLATSFACAQTNPGGTADPELSSGFGKKANYDQLQGHQHGSLAFVGKVTVVGGPLPWDPIPVVVLCNGKTRYNTRADLKGLFRIEAEAAVSEVAPGAPNTKRMAPADLIGCSVRAALEGFSSSAVTIANRSIMDDADIGTITLSVDEKAKGTAQSNTTLTAPKDARKSFDKARAEAADGHLDNAQRDLDKAAHAYPQFAEAWYQLGKLQEAKNPQSAWDSFSKAAGADPQFAPTYEHIAALAAVDKKWQEVADATAHALALDPAGTPQIWYYSAVGNYNLGHKDVAEKAAVTSLAMDPSHVAPNTEQLLAVMLADRHDYAGALTHLRNCLTYTPAGPKADLMKQQVAQLEKIVPVKR